MLNKMSSTIPVLTLLILFTFLAFGASPAIAAGSPASGGIAQTATGVASWFDELVARVEEALLGSPLSVRAQSQQDIVEHGDSGMPDATDPGLGISPMADVISDPDG